MSGRGPRLLCAAGLAAWTLLIWRLLTAPRVSVGPLFPGSGLLFEIGHALLFGVQALLILALLVPGEDEARARGRRLLAGSLALIYSGLIELVQGTLPERSASWADLITNAIGAFGCPWILAAREGRLRARRLLLVAAGALASGLLAWSTGW